MKELTIEEKAKRYDKALEKAKMVLQERGNEPDGASMLSNLFPELAESEDERIRKNCIKYLDLEYQHCSTNEDKIKIEKCIDWLEKQGRFISNTSIVASNEESLIPDIDKPKFAVGAYVTDDGETYFLIIGYADSMYQLETVEGTSGRFPKEIVERKFRLWSIEDAKDGDVLANCNIICMLEKLDKEGDVVTHCVYTVQDGFEVLCGSRTIGPFNLKPATKEQRDLLFQKMKETGYEWDAEKKELKKFSIENTVQTIEIQKPVEWSEEDKDIIDSLVSFLKNELSSSQTDEDRKLFKRQIEIVKSFHLQPKKEWSEEDKENFNLICFYLNSPELAGDKYSYLFNWLKSLKDRVQPQSKTTWSEEDEEYINDLIGVFDGQQYQAHYDEEIVNWLKSLKDRCILQPKQEWSEEDEQRIENLIAIIEGRGYPGEVIWLKNLKNRVQPQPKQEWTKNDEYYRGIILYCLDGVAVGALDKKNAISWLKSLKDRCLPQPKQEWSEEDELRIENLIAIIEGRGYPGEVIWLKNLKNRVQPQPKQEWSEEDEKMIRALVSMCDVWATSHQFYPKENKEMEALKTWLKSLRPQKKWKPSEEQMNALKNVIDGYKSLEDKEGIKSLYEQLKAL